MAEGRKKRARVTIGRVKVAPKRKKARVTIGPVSVTPKRKKPKKQSQCPLDRAWAAGWDSARGAVSAPRETERASRAVRSGRRRR